MKAKHIVLLVMILLLGLGVTQLKRVLSGQTREFQIDAVRKILDDQVAAWNRGDLDAFMIGYRKGDDLRFFSGGTITSGWQDTLERYRKRYQTDGAEMGQLEFRDLRVDILGADAALVRGRWHLTRKADTPNGLFTLILRHDPEGWRIVHDHTSAAE